jgi:hypothetical protein
MAATPNSQSQGNTQAPPGYPEAPNFPNAGFNPGPQAGQPTTVDQRVQGLTLMSPCPAGCGRAIMPDDLGAHVQLAHGEAPYTMGREFMNDSDSDFGKAEL